MNSQSKLNRREFLGAATTIGVASLVGCAPARRVEERPIGRLPARGEFVVRNAQVLTMDPSLGDLSRGDIHVRDGEIIAVGAELAAPGAEAIDGRDMIALPGFIDTHCHIWNSALRNLVGGDPEMGYFALTFRLGQHYTPTDIYRGVRLGVAEMLYSGITCVHDWSHNIRGPEYADADLRALSSTGIRARFSYGTPQGGISPDEPMDLADLARVQREWFSDPNDRLLTLGMASCSLGSSPRGAVNIAGLHRDWDGARKLGLPISFHTGRVPGPALLEKEGLLGPEVQLVNPTNYEEADRAAVARSGAHVSVSPREEVLSLVMPQIVEMLNQGIVVSLSHDTTSTSGNINMFAQMHALMGFQGFGLSAEAPSASARQVLEMATINGARDLGIADRVGSLTPGKRADLILVRATDLNIAPLANPVHAIVRSAQPHNVDTVVVDGRILKHNGQLVALDAEQVAREAAESLAAVRKRAGVL